MFPAANSEARTCYGLSCYGVGRLLTKIVIDKIARGI